MNKTQKYLRCWVKINCGCSTSITLYEWNSISVIWPPRARLQRSILWTQFSTTLAHIRPNYVSGMKTAPNSHFLRMQRCLKKHIWVCCWPITHILLINKAIEPEMSFIAEDDFSMTFTLKVATTDSEFQ